MNDLRVFSLIFRCLIVGLFLLVATSSLAAQENLVPLLLDVPAPPAPNPNFSSGPAERTPAFFDHKNPPPDYAPIEDLLEYWASQNSVDPERYFVVIPSDTVIDRLLTELEKRPEDLNDYYRVFQRVPSSFARIRRFYETEAQKERDEDDYQIYGLKSWLTRFGALDIDSIVTEANSIADTDEYLTNQDALLRLALIDWDRAEPIAERLAENSDQPISRTLGYWVLYRHAYNEGSSVAEDKYRGLLMDVVADKSAKPGNRDLALDALSKVGDFSGRDDWYLGLLEDETLAELRVNGSLYTGLTTMINHAPPERFIEALVRIVDSGSATARTAAARNLGTLLFKDDIRVHTALLPWLGDKDWAKETGGERRNLTRALADYKIPESVPGLVQILDEKAAPEKPEDGDKKTAGTDKPEPVTDSDIHPYRHNAIRALAKQEDIRAVAPLKRILPVVDAYNRQATVTAIYQSGGYSDFEQVGALEAQARTEVDKTKAEFEEALTRVESLKSRTSAPDLKIADSGADESPTTGFTIDGGVDFSDYSRYENEADDSDEAFDPAKIPEMLAISVISSKEHRYSFLRAMIDRARQLDRTEPYVAAGMREFLSNWEGEAYNTLILEELRAGRSNTDLVLKLLANRKLLRENQGDLIFDARASQFPENSSIAACLLENETEYDAIIESNNSRAIKGLLACGRLIRAEFDVKKVAKFLKSEDKLMVLAASEYLLSNDSSEAQQILYEFAPDRGWILGSRKTYGFGSADYSDSEKLEPLFVSVGISPAAIDSTLFWDTGKFDGIEQRLRKEVLTNDRLIGIYWFADNFVHLYEDKAVFSWEEDPARYKTRILDEAELKSLNDFLAYANLGETPAFLAKCDSCEEQQLITVGKQGGRRVYFSTDQPAPFLTQLEKVFENLRNRPAKLRYRLEDEIEGVNVLFAADKLAASRIWDKDGKPIVLIVDPEKQTKITEELKRLLNEEREVAKIGIFESQRRSSERALNLRMEGYSWYEVKSKSLGAQISPPQNFERYPMEEAIMPEYLSHMFAFSDSKFLFAGNDGLYSGEDLDSGAPPKLRDGKFSNPVVNKIGSIGLFLAYNEKNEPELHQIDLRTGKSAVLKFPDGDTGKPVKYLSKSGKFLLSGESGKSYLLDPANLKFETISGSVLPLIEFNEGGLQEADNGEYWASMSAPNGRDTRVGKYNLKTYKFEEIGLVRGIKFGSGEFWVDDKTLDTVIVYNKQLIRVPLKPKPVVTSGQNTDPAPLQ